jgi:hypothetical protein
MLGVRAFLAVIEPFKDIEDARTLAQAIVDSEPMLVLDSDLHVLAVSRSYYLNVQGHRQDVLGRPLSALGDGQWHIPALRNGSGENHPGARRHGRVRGRAEFPRIGRRIMLLEFVGAELRRRADQLLTPQTVEYYLTELQAQFPALVSVARHYFSIEELARHLRECLSKRSSIKNLPRILEDFISAEGDSSAALLSTTHESATEEHILQSD